MIINFWKKTKMQINQECGSYILGTVKTSLTEWSNDMQALIVMPFKLLCLCLAS